MAGRAKKEAAPDTKAAITKGQATGKAPAPKDDLKKCKELYEVVHMQIESGGVFINLDGIPYLIRQIGYEKIGDEAEQEIFCGGGLSKIAVQIADEIADGNAKGSGQSPEQAEQRRQERRNPDIGIGKIENRF